MIGAETESRRIRPGPDLRQADYIDRYQARIAVESRV